MVVDVLSGLSFLHCSRIIHRDIKPQNVLVCEDGSVKISDFGIACETDEACWIVDTQGTYPFYAPEMCAGGGGYKGHDGRRADIWALGVTLWAFVHGTVPFYKESASDLFEEIAKARLVFPPEVASSGCRATLIRLLAARPADRPLAWELDDDAWLHDP